MRFAKMHGIGNDYVYIEGFTQNISDPAQLATIMSDRHFGVGSDGLILILPSKVADCRMRMFNADGSEGEMCGNGIRCVAKFAYEENLAAKETMTVETSSGIKTLSLEVKAGLVKRVRVNMGAPVFRPQDIPVDLPGERVLEAALEVDGQTCTVSCISMGNPHCILFVEDVDSAPVTELGPKIERHLIFSKKTNVEFVQVISPEEVRQRTWERGTGETLACGTGASAVCVAGVLTGRTKGRIINHLTGGDLLLEWEGGDSPVWMTGPAEHVFWGEWPKA